jgi:hypothetical protein
MRNHNHNDVGDFIVYANNEPVIIDAGTGLYSKNFFFPPDMNCGLHNLNINLPIVNGKGQWMHDYEPKKFNTNIREIGTHQHHTSSAYGSAAKGPLIMETERVG